MITGKCPYCKALVSNVKIETIDLFDGMDKLGVGTSYISTAPLFYPCRWTCLV
jgi:hypothetical protein